MQDTKSIYKNQLNFYILTTNHQKEKIREKNPFTIASKRIKFIGINLTNEVRDLYTENCKTLMKESEEDIN